MAILTGFPPSNTINSRMWFFSCHLCKKLHWWLELKDQPSDKGPVKVCDRCARGENSPVKECHKR